MRRRRCGGGGKKAAANSGLSPLSRIECPGLELVASSEHEPALLLLCEEQLDRGTAILANTLLSDVDRFQRYREVLRDVVGDVEVELAVWLGVGRALVAI